MNDADAGQGSLSARALLGAFGVADPDSTAADLEADWNRMNMALGEAVTACQLFETHVRLASPVFEADGTDELAAREALNAGLSSRLGTSIKALNATTHPDLVDGLTRFADVRNRIVHDGLIGRLLALVQGNADIVVNDLAEATEHLVGQIAVLSELMWGHVAATTELGDTDPEVISAALLAGAVADRRSSMVCQNSRTSEWSWSGYSSGSTDSPDPREAAAGGPPGAPGSWFEALPPVPPSQFRWIVRPDRGSLSANVCSQQVGGPWVGRVERRGNAERAATGRSRSSSRTSRPRVSSR